MAIIRRHGEARRDNRHVSRRIGYAAWLTIGLYGAGVGTALVLAYRAGSAQIAAAARLIAIGWLFSLQFWILFDRDYLAQSFFLLDVALAAAFYQLSRGRWFPAPLFFLHAATAIFNLYIIFVDQGPVWMIAILNRSFDLTLAYIIACAIYRIRRSAQ